MLFQSRNFLLVSVFITGACVLIVEVVAVRILSPYFGNTIFSFSSVISVILAALSIGYYYGGKLADGYPKQKYFFGLISASGVVLVVLYLLGQILLPALSYFLPITVGPLVSSLLLFFLPALLLGTLSPYAVKLQSLLGPQEGIGSLSGKIFFWSTVGSIFGSLLAGFVLIPILGINLIIIAVGAVLFLLGAVPLLFARHWRKNIYQSFLFLFVMSSSILFGAGNINAEIIYDQDGVYERLIVYDKVVDGRPVRFFQQDRSNSSAMFLDSDDPTDLVHDYTKYYVLYEIFKPEVNNALVLGGGIYSVPKALLVEPSIARVDVVEIEPSLIDLAKKYFNFKEDDRLHNHVQDGRRFLVDNSQQYDFIFSDVYHSLYSVPAHFTTKEFFKLAKTRLSVDGIFMANLIGDLSIQEPSFILSEIKTFQTVFPNSYFFAVDSVDKVGVQNIIVVGYNSDKKIDLKSEAITSNSNPVIQALSDHELKVADFDLESHKIFTDNFSPVEYYSAQVLRRAF